MKKLFMWLFMLGMAPTPIKDAIPRNAEARIVPGTNRVYHWERNPNRVTRFWRGVNGLLFCDDPDCPYCKDTVYGCDDSKEVIIRCEP